MWTSGSKENEWEMLMQTKAKQASYCITPMAILFNRLYKKQAQVFHRMNSEQGTTWVWKKNKLFYPAQSLLNNNSSPVAQTKCFLLFDVSGETSGDDYLSPSKLMGSIANVCPDSLVHNFCLNNCFRPLSSIFYGQHCLELHRILCWFFVCPSLTQEHCHRKDLIYYKNFFPTWSWPAKYCEYLLSKEVYFCI